MNYKESPEILKEIKKAKKILFNLHRGPDGDSIGSALGFAEALKIIGKDVSIVYTKTSQISENLLNLPNAQKVKQVDFSTFDFGQYDLFIITDSAEWLQVTDNKDVKIPSNIKKIVIDHHATNYGFGDINIIDSTKSSCAEIVYLTLKDMKLEINKTSATLFLAGILSDTGMFRFAKGPETLTYTSELMELGGDKDFVVQELISSMDFNSLKMYGEFISRMQIDAKYKFMYTAVPYEVYKKYGKPAKVSSYFSTAYGAVLKGTNFGIVILEKEKNKIDISFRSKENFDISGMATELGGGGHRQAAGGQILDVEFDEAIKKVLEIARKYVAENLERN